jgi:peptide/nickel transport system substrate-binding protein
MATLTLRVASLLCVAAATPVKVGLTSITGTFDPRVGSVPWSLVSHGIAEKLFTVNKQGMVVGQLAQSVTNVDKYTWRVTLTPNYKFSDGTAVTADHIVTSLQTQNTQNPNGDDALGVMTVTKVDATTIQIASTMSHPAMDAALANWVFVIFLQTGSNYLYTGPFAVQNSSSTQINLIPNAYYPVTTGTRPSVSLMKYSTGEVLANALAAGDVDLAFHLPVGRKAGLQAAGITVQTFDVGYHYMMFPNTRPSSVLHDLNVRKAVDLVINRQALATALQAGTGTRSLFPSSSPYFQADTVATSGDKAAAEALLNTAGWPLQNGIRSKNGVQLSLYLVAYPFRPGLGLMQPSLKTDFQSLGIQVNDVNVDLWSAPHNTILSGKTYDLLMWAQHTLPNGDPQWFLNAFFRGNPMSGNNFAGINSSVIDGNLDTLAHAGHANNQRTNAVTAVHSSITSDAAVMNLVMPQWHVGMRGRMACYDPWGSDYYIIRADLRDCAIPVPDTTVSGAVRAALGSLSLAILLHFA